jgi:response regulator RpfG family c-di-GMP phosphodiesterase
MTTPKPPVQPAVPMIELPKRMVYVDDQRDNLIVFEAQVAEHWDIKCYFHTSDALREIKEYNPAIILSDMKMGKVNGVDFLLRAKDIVPNAVRIVISGYSDEELMLAAIRYAQIFDFIRKPYDANDVEARLQKALVQYDENVKTEAALKAMQNYDKLLGNENSQLKHLVDIKNQKIAQLESELTELNKNLRLLVGNVTDHGSNGNNGNNGNNGKPNPNQKPPLSNPAAPAQPIPINAAAKAVKKAA